MLSRCFPNDEQAVSFRLRLSLFASSEKSIVPNFAVDRLNEGFDVSGTECERLETARIIRVTGRVIIQMNTSRAVIMSGPVRGPPPSNF